MFYGTTYWGGNNSDGVVFKMTPSGEETVLHDFSGGADGQYPSSSLTAENAMLFGTTYRGGGAKNAGTVFKISTAGSEIILHKFGQYTDGLYPRGELNLVNGALFGATEAGGNRNGTSGLGTIFKISKSGAFRVLHRFTVAEGAFPYGDLTFWNNAFYGVTASYGGPQGNGQGTIFKMTPSGVVTTLYVFRGGRDGAVPNPGLVVFNGSLFGTTWAGGGTGCMNQGCGTVFKMTFSGVETVIHRMTRSDGTNPEGPLTKMSQRFFGTTSGGGQKGYGTIFSMSSTGDVTVVHEFRGGLSGRSAEAGMISVGRSLYGSTGGGGAHGYGLLFRLDQ